MRFVAQYLDIAPGATSDGTAAVDGPELFAVFHESFRTFLVRKLGACVDALHRRWSDVLSGLRDKLGDERIFAVRHYCSHLVASQRWGELRTTLTDLEFIEAKCLAGLAYELQDDYALALSALPGGRIHDPFPKAGQSLDLDWMAESVAASADGRADPHPQARSRPAGASSPRARSRRAAFRVARPALSGGTDHI